VVVGDAQAEGGYAVRSFHKTLGQLDLDWGYHYGFGWLFELV
jgi:hypothetical protein